MGWICPSCRSAYAPFVPKCSSCPKEVSVEPFPYPYPDPWTPAPSEPFWSICTCQITGQGSCPVHCYYKYTFTTMSNTAEIKKYRVVDGELREILPKFFADEEWNDCG